MGYDHEAVGGFHGDVSKIPERIIADVRVDGGSGEVGSRAGIDECIAVGFGARDLRGTERAAAAGPVLDVKVLLEYGRQFPCEQASQLVRASPGSKRHDDLH